MKVKIINVKTRPPSFNVTVTYKVLDLNIIGEVTAFCTKEDILKEVEADARKRIVEVFNAAKLKELEEELVNKEFDIGELSV